MTVNVHMLAFCNGDIREVHIPNYLRPASTADLLNLVFDFGQNETQQRPQPSVSVGDVIELTAEGKTTYHVVRGFGFGEMSPEDLTAYRRIPQHDRAWSHYVRPANFPAPRG